MERMTYREASSFLGVHYGSLLNAIKRGVLTPLPRKGVVRYLPSEQVGLFKGKPLALSALTKEEGEIWKRTVSETGTPLPRLSVLPYLSEEEGLEQGERFGRGFRRGAENGIKKIDPNTEGELASPLAS